MALAASKRRRQARQRTLDLNRSTWPQSMQVREQRTHRPVLVKRRSSPQDGQLALRAASRSAARQRQHRVSALRPTPAPQRVQSAVLTTGASSARGALAGARTALTGSGLGPRRAWRPPPRRRWACSQAPCTAPPASAASVVPAPLSITPRLKQPTSPALPVLPGADGAAPQSRPHLCRRHPQSPLDVHGLPPVHPKCRYRVAIGILDKCRRRRHVTHRRAYVPMPEHLLDGDQVDSPLVVMGGASVARPWGLNPSPSGAPSSSSR